MAKTLLVCGRSGAAVAAAPRAVAPSSATVIIYDNEIGLRQGLNVIIYASMNATQSRMARAALGWSREDLAKACDLATRTVVRFEDGDTVAGDTVKAIRAAFERAGVAFVESGPYRGGVVPPIGTASS